MEGYAARLALVTHFIRWATSDPLVLDPRTPIDETSVAAGIVLARWFGDEAKRVYAILSESDGDRESRELVEWIKGKGGAVTIRDLARGPRAYKNDTERADKSLTDLVAAGLGRWEHVHNPKGGRPTKKFVLSEASGAGGDSDETPVDAKSRGGSVTVTNVTLPTNAGDGWGEI